MLYGPEELLRASAIYERMISKFSTVIKYYAIDAHQLNALEAIQKRLHTEARMDGNEMRDAGHTIEAILRVVRQLEIPE